MRLDSMEYEVAEPTVPTGRRATRTEYTPADDKHLVKYLVRHADLGRTGNAVYQHMEKKYPRHTWQSWRERYKKNELRFDREIAKYSQLVQDRRWNQEEPYSDSDAEVRPKKSLKGTTSGTSAARRTSAVSADKAPASEAVPQPRFKPLSLVPVPILPVPVPVPTPPTPIVPAELHAATASRQPLTEMHNLVTSARKAFPSEAAPQPVPSTSSPRKRKISQVDLVPEATVPSRSPRRDQRPALVVVSEHAELRSKAFPSSLMRDEWDPTRLEYGISAQQMADLVYCCSGSQSLAKEFVHLIADGVTTPRAGHARLKVLSKLIWRPEEDAAVVRTREDSTLPAALTRRHSDEAIAERRRFLSRGAEEVGKARFPFDVT